MKNCKTLGLVMLAMAGIACSRKAPPLDQMPHLAKLRPANQ